MIDNELSEIERIRETQKKRFIKKVAILLFVLGITTSAFIVATYAWFIGITTVNVNKFEIDVSTLPGLQISLDGENFGDNITVSEEILESLGGNNHWV